MLSRLLLSGLFLSALSASQAVANTVICDAHVTRHLNITIEKAGDSARFSVSGFKASLAAKEMGIVDQSFSGIVKLTGVLPVSSCRISPSDQPVGNCSLNAGSNDHRLQASDHYTGELLGEMSLNFVSVSLTQVVRRYMGSQSDQIFTMDQIDARVRLGSYDAMAHADFSETNDRGACRVAQDTEQVAAGSSLWK